MPKTNHGGATYYGHEGIVENARGELSQLDPSRNVDGSVVDGFESDERQLEDRENGQPVADPTGVSVAEDPKDEKNDGAEERAENEEEREEPQPAAKPKPAKRTARSTRSALPGK
jgi:hypothetical protein